MAPQDVQTPVVRPSYASADSRGPAARTTARLCYKAQPVRRILAMTSRAGICLAGLMFAAQALSFEQVTAQETSQTITVTSPTVKEGQPVPRQHTPDGRNDSPAITWSGVPSAARSLMVFCED